MDDYEHTNARIWNGDKRQESREDPGAGNWEVVDTRRKRVSKVAAKSEQLRKGQPRRWHNASGRQRNSGARLPASQLVYRPANDGETAWRAREAPADRIRIPDTLLIDDKGNSRAEHQRLATQHGTWIFTKHLRGASGSVDFGIWGEVAAVAAAKAAILAWIEEENGNKSLRSDKFAKVVSLTPELRKRAEKRWEREVARQKYRQHPPPGMAFGSIGSFHWPTLEYRPEDVLGNGYEALDPIRMDCSCHIVFDPDRKIFKILGKPLEVQEALQRLMRTVFQVTAKQVYPVRLYLLRWQDAAQVAPFIYLTNYEPPAILSPAQADPPVARKAPACDPDGPVDESAIELACTLTARASERLRRELLRMLRKLHYYRGHLQLRFRLGTFLVDQYKDAADGVYEYEGNGEYLEMLEESQFSGEVTQELGARPTEQALLQACQASSDLLMPAEVMIHDLAEVRPLYIAVFTFAVDSGNYRLQVEWRETDDGGYRQTNAVTLDLVSKRWSRLDRESTSLSSIIDASMSDLNTSTAWQVDLLAAPQVVEEGKLPSELAPFSRHLRASKVTDIDANAACSFASWNPFTRLVSVQQRISLQYTITNSDYTLELSRFQDRRYAINPKVAITQANVYEPRWSLNLFRKDWDSMLAENERLKIGERADWPDDVDRWFPRDVGPTAEDMDDRDALQGWRQMFEKLEVAEKLVRRAMEMARTGERDESEGEVGGMAVVA